MWASTGVHGCRGHIRSSEPPGEVQGLTWDDKKKELNVEIGLEPRSPNSLSISLYCDSLTLPQMSRVSKSDLNKEPREPNSLPKVLSYWAPSLPLKGCQQKDCEIKGLMSFSYTAGAWEYHNVLWESCWTWGLWTGEWCTYKVGKKGPGWEEKRPVDDSSLAQAVERASPGKFLPYSPGTSVDNAHTWITSPLQTTNLHPYMLNHRLINHTHYVVSTNSSNLCPLPTCLQLVPMPYLSNLFN